MKKNVMQLNSRKDDWHDYQVIKAAWLYFIEGKSQKDVASILSTSQPSVNRLIAEAQRQNLVTITMERRPAECMELEGELQKRFGLSNCVVVPVTNAVSSRFEDVMPAVSKVAGSVIATMLESQDISRVGVGFGRTLLGVFQEMRLIDRDDLEAVSITGSLTRELAANRMDSFQHLAPKLRGDIFMLPVPYLARTEQEKETFLAQPSVQQLLKRAREADQYIVGIGSVDTEGHLAENLVLSLEELDALRAEGAIGDLMGCFFDIDGHKGDTAVSRLAVGVSPDEVRGKPVTAVVCGANKDEATLAVLRSGVLTGLIVDEFLARRVIALDEGATR